MRIKLCDSHLTCKVANKCLNNREWVEVVEWNKRWSPPFPCCPVSRQCLWKKPWQKKKCKNLVKIFFKNCKASGKMISCITFATALSSFLFSRFSLMIRAKSHVFPVIFAQLWSHLTRLENVIFVIDWFSNYEIIFIYNPKKRHHVYSTLKRRGRDRFHVVST